MATTKEEMYKALRGPATSAPWVGRQVDPGLPSARRQMDPAVKRLMMNMVGARIIGDPKLRNILQGVLFARNPSKQAGLNLLTPQIQRAGIMGLLKKFGPSALYALSNRGGAFGLGTGGPLGQGVLPSLARNPLGAMGRVGFAASNPLIALLMAGLNKASPQIAGQKGPLGGSVGPQVANLASKMFPKIQSTQEWLSGGGGKGILGGTVGPRTKNFFRNLLGISPSIQEFDMSTLPTKRGSIQEFDMSTLPTKRGTVEEVYTPTGYIPQGASSGSSSAFPRGK